eukprot:m.118524 g.118524  ORF g.118524 m.118524 type:complete len:201 (+) comp9343_c2_seq2:2-604(+)
MHRDLKSGNVLVTKRLAAKITDFGSMSGKLAKLSAVGNDVASSHVTSFDLVNFDQEGQLMYDPTSLTRTMAPSATMTNGVGTPLYMAPEVLDYKNRHLSLKADVFSFGVLMWEVWMCKVPDLIEQELGNDFQGMLFGTLFELYLNGKTLQFEEGTPKQFADIAQQCMVFDPAQRPSFRDLVLKIQTKSNNYDESDYIEKL